MSALRETPAFGWQITRFRSDAEARCYVSHSGVVPQGSGPVVLCCVLGPKGARIAFWTLHGTVVEAKAQRDTTREQFVEGGKL